MLVRRAALSIAVLSIVPLAGCGTKQLDTSQIESQLKTKIGAQTPVKSVDCPSSVDVKKGATFDCTLTSGSGKKYTLTVEQTDENGHVQVKSTKPAS
jgi:NAD(P)H-hydrate repair Nnr-like enzyme with NAD(P)H-hydrate epimerase domain